jgi:hypothetical protein
VAVVVLARVPILMLEQTEIHPVGRQQILRKPAVQTPVAAAEAVLVVLPQVQLAQIDLAVLVQQDM